MATEWAYEYIIAFGIADKSIGKAFVKRMAPFPSDTNAEDGVFEVTRLKSLGDQTNTTVAFMTICPCKQDFYDFFQAVKEGAPFSDPRYDFAKSRNVTLSQFNALKAAVLFINVRQKRDLVTNEEIPRPVTIDQYLAARGYEVISQ